MLHEITSLKRVIGVCMNDSELVGVFMFYAATSSNNAFGVLSDPYKKSRNSN